MSSGQVADRSIMTSCFPSGSKWPENVPGNVIEIHSSGITIALSLHWQTWEATKTNSADEDWQMKKMR